MLRGIVTSFDETKGYGFIKGDDKKDYFFHKNNFLDKNAEIYDGLALEFDTKATPKGYSAYNIKALSDEAVGYEAPSEFLVSKAMEIKGYKVLKVGQNTIESYTTKARQNPQEARDALIQKAKSLGANALLGLNYQKGTLSDFWSGGRYKYTSHIFKAHLAVVGKKSATPNIDLDNLPNFDKVKNTDTFDNYTSTAQGLIVAFIFIIVIIAAIVFGSFR
ncbi:MAG: cold shock domain-containing protein [Helicobacter sp.]|nr:cold shock domain-containing protein [Helicobacteraceae bacterium]MDY3113291.1 cold shock domain-containing protein [Helicobacter sp.]